MELANILELIHAVSDSDLTEFNLQDDTLNISMSKEKTIVQQMAVNTDPADAQQYQPVVQQAVHVESVNAVNDEVQTGSVVKSPLVGTYYAASSPENPPFVKVGDKVFILVNDKYHELNIDYIVENYIDDYAYITEDTYKEIYNDYDVNSIYLNVNDNYNEDYDKELLSNSNIVNIINKKDTSNVMEGVLDKLNYVVLILIISSALLAFAILYNLSSINISERKREISTLKVLGFYNDEVDRYITNENYFITVVGIILGLILGFYLCFYL